MLACRLCQFPKIEPLLNLGSQPLCNRFLTSVSDEEATFPFALGQCHACGMIQILNPVPTHELKPRFDWINYREAEGHLNELVDEICRLPGVTTASIIGGISSKDDSILERFQKRGFAKTGRVDVTKDLGPADVLIVRHIVEHAHQTSTFIAALRHLVRPDGYLVIELPDCGPGLKRADYTMPWEEHILYFTEDLLRQAVGCWGLPAVSYKLYPYSHENSLVVILRLTTTDKAVPPDPSITEAALTLGARYAWLFDGYRRQVSDAITNYRNTQGRVAVFGAGHLSCTWINVFGLRDHIDFIVDDDPLKAGLFMPGSRLPILPSSQLVEREIKLCLLSLNQESETKVIQDNHNFLSSGGTFASIFPGRSNSFVSEPAP